MTDRLMELGAVMLSTSERRLESVSRNIANVSTPGFKKESAFKNALSSASTDTTRASVDFSQGALRLTGATLDIALSGAGFFKLRDSDRILFGRNGQFQRLPNGNVANAQGMLLQTASGEDLTLTSTNVEILQDGTVLENGAPIARIGVFAPVDDSAIQAAGSNLFSAQDSQMTETAAPLLRQGMVEGSNVELASEMVEMMSALRQAETGARVIQTFDSLIGQSVSTFGRGIK